SLSFYPSTFASPRCCSWQDRKIRGSGGISRGRVFPRLRVPPQKIHPCSAEWREEGGPVCVCRQPPWVSRLPAERRRPAPGGGQRYRNALKRNAKNQPNIQALVGLQLQPRVAAGIAVKVCAEDLWHDREGGPPFLLVIADDGPEEQGRVFPDAIVGQLIVIPH